MDYETLRQAADSWGLVYLFLIFLGIIVFVFRPGSKKSANNDAMIPFKEDEDDGAQRD